MKTSSLTLALVLSLSLASAAIAQSPPSGGPDAKGNAPIKSRHTINDGMAKSGANSFTEGEAQKHIANSGYASVSGLTKGDDGVWRGTAMKGGVTRQVGLDFKGNVTDGGPATGSGSGAKVVTTTTTRTSSSSKGAMSETTTERTATTGHVTHRHHVRHRAHCATPNRNGVACSGIDRNKNGISDKEDRAIKAGTKP